MNSDIKVPKSWKPNAAVQKTIQDTLANDPKKKETIEKSIQRFKEKNSKGESSSTTTVLADSTSSSSIAPNNVQSTFATYIQAAMSTAAVDRASNK